MSNPGPNIKRNRRAARPLSDMLGACLNDTFARQGFAARDIVTHWDEIAGADVAALAEPLKIQWPRAVEPEPAAPATLVLRVEGPAAIEIQHLAPVIIARVNRFFGWQAVGRLAFRQAPLTGRKKKRPRPALDPALANAIAAKTGIADDELRTAMGRLGAAINTTGTPSSNERDRAAPATKMPQIAVLKEPG